MTTEELKTKYGDEMVWVIPSDTVTHNPDVSQVFYDDEIDFCTKKGEAKYRWEVENDPSYKQPIVYAVLTCGLDVFSTHRLAGDPRLTGKYSIGTGGHMVPGETITQTLFRELEEEVGVTPDDMVTISREGYILDESSPVNSVHLGIVYVIEVSHHDTVQIKETEKLAGEWLTPGELARLNRDGKLESWSEYVFKHWI